MDDKEKINFKLWDEDETGQNDQADDGIENSNEDEDEDEIGPGSMLPDPQLKLSVDEFRYRLGDYRLDQLKEFHWALLGVAAPALSKAGLCTKVATYLHFRTQERFNHYFTSLPRYTQEAILIGVNFRHVSVKHLEDRYKIKILDSRRVHYYADEDGIFEKEFRLELFKVVDATSLYLPGVFRLAFRPWIPLPPEAVATPFDHVEGHPWSNSESLEEVLPLLVDSIGAPVMELGLRDTVYKGLPKLALRSIKQACGQKEFPLAGKYGLDSIELAIRLIISIEGKIPKRPTDSDKYVKDLVHRFFGLSTSVDGQYNGVLRYLEPIILFDHLKLFPGANGLNRHQLGMRSGFHAVLHRIGLEGRWYDVSQLCRAELVQNRLLSEDVIQYLRAYYVKGNHLVQEGLDYFSDSYQKGFEPVGLLQYPLLELPLFKAYCYVMAVLGLVDIIETEPDLALQSNGKKIPISPYDALSHIRVNPFGAWCLGLSKTRPQRAKLDFETITDDELLLVTFRGKSLERKLFLEQIGQQLGEERYRISETTFVRGCKNLQEIETRIERFKQLLNPTPSVHWLAFFKNIRNRAVVFTSPQPCLLFDLPSDPALKQQIMDDPQLRKLMIRAEGNRIVIRFEDLKALQKLLVQKGFLDIEIQQD